MRIEWSQQVGHNSELSERWRAVVKRTHAFSKIAGIEFTRRRIRLDVLLGILELEYAQREANRISAERVTRTQKRSLILLAGFFILIFALDFLLIWPRGDNGFYILAGVFFFILVGGNLEAASFHRERAAAHRAILTAILEFERVSGARFPHYDLELLDEDRMVYKPDNEDELGQRRAELTVNVMERLVERIEMLDMEKPIKP